MSTTTIAAEPLYTFRKLNATDVFLMCKIIGKIGVNEFLGFFTEEENMAKLMECMKGDSKEGMMEFGFSIARDLANILLVNLPACENEFYQMLSQTSNLTTEQVKTLEMGDFIKMVIDFIRKEEFRDFLSVVVKSFK